MAEGESRLSRVWDFIKTNPAIIYSIALLVVLPTILSGYAWWITNSYQGLLDASVQKQAVLVHRSIEALLSGKQDNRLELESQMTRLHSALGGDVVDYTVLVPSENGSSFEPIAGFTGELKLESIFTQTQYALSWYEDRSFATTAKEPRSGGRLMLVTRPIRDEFGNKWGLATIALSLAEHDKLVVDMQWKSSLILIVSVLVVLLLVANHARLFNYALELHRREGIDKMKDEFLSVASHELRTPIAGLRSFLSLLREKQFGRLSAEGTEYVEKAVVQTDKLSQLVDDMLDVVRIEQGEVDYRWAEIIVGEEAAEVIEELRFKAEEKGLKLELATEDTRRIKVDREQLRRVLVNLIGNAIKYTKKGGVSVFAADSERKVVEIKVRDTGIGIPPDKVSTLFKKFSRVHSDETANIQGTGLGLWITKALVEGMGGKIFVNSIYGEGSEFTVLFPAAGRLKKRARRGSDRNY